MIIFAVRDSRSNDVFALFSKSKYAEDYIGDDKNLEIFEYILDECLHAYPLNAQQR